MKVHIFGAASGIGRWIIRNLLAPSAEHKRNMPWQEAVLWDVQSTEELNSYLRTADAQNPDSRIGAELFSMSFGQVPKPGGELAVDRFAEGDLLLLAVPENALPTLADQLKVAIKTNTTVLSLTSVQQGALAILKEKLPEAHVGGLHLLFGPLTETLANQNAVLVDCEGEHQSSATKELEQFLRSLQMNVSHASAQQHDKAMAYIQTMTHFTLMMFAEMFASADKDIDWQQMATPSFQTLVNLAERMLQQSPETLASIQAGVSRNEARGQTLEVMSELHDRFAQADSSEGIEDLAATIQDIAEKFQNLLRRKRK